MRHYLNLLRSRAVRSVRYRKRDKTLTVVYHNGGRYIYLGVERATWRRVKASDSLGGAMNRIIKPNHDAVRVG
jgi:hypothetical protein